MGIQFSENTAQKEAVRYFQNALRTGEISHAYILCGEHGSGRKELALAFAAALQCTDRKEVNGLLEPCGLCHSCLQVQSGSHPDIITVSRQPNTSGRLAALGIGEIRKVVSDVRICPYSDPWKIYIIEDAETMTVQAQNALLKTLEEPPAYAVLILLANGTGGFLPTVMSRCITLRMRPLSEEEIVRSLIRQGIPEEKAVSAAGLAGGNVGRAVMYAQEEELIRLREETVQLLRDLKSRTGFDFLGIAGNITEADKKDTEEHLHRTDAFLDMLRAWIRDILIYKETGSDVRLIFKDEVQYIKVAADSCGFEQIEQALQAFDAADRQRAAGTPDVQVLEVLLLRLRSALN